MKAYLVYNLGMQDPPHWKTTRGSVVHKAYEIITRSKMARIADEIQFDGEDLGVIKVSDVSEESACRMAFEHYRKLEQPHWTEDEFQDCYDVFKLCIHGYNGVYHPENLNIIAAEQQFDFELRYDWAWYEHTLPDGTEFQGYLSCKGTIDSVTSPKPGVIEYIDLKSGKRIDWGTGKEKTFDKLMEDPQLMLYYLALNRLYPDIDQIVMTIFFITDGGPFTLPYEKSDIPKIETELCKWFRTIWNTKTPKLRNDWFCYRLCHFGKNKYAGSNNTICKHFANEISIKGMDEVTLEYGNLDQITRYASGGGRQAK